MRYFTLIGSILISGFAFAANPTGQSKGGELRAFDLAVEKASSYRNAEPLIHPASLDALELNQGRVRLSGRNGLNLTFEKPLKTFAANLDDPKRDSVYELRWYRDQYLLGTRRFAPAALGLPDVNAIIDGRIAIETNVPFDRIELKEIHGSIEGDDEYVTGVQATVAGASDEKTRNLLAFACQLPLGLAYNVAFAAGLLAIDPITAAIADSAGYTANLGLKFCNTVLEPPPDLTGRVASGSCSKSLEQPHLVAEYENALGIPLVFEYDWGDLGTPLVYHHNTEVEVGAYYGTPTPPDSGTLDLKLLIEDRALTTDATDLIYQECRDDGSVATSQLNGAGKEYACPYVEGRTIDFPVGRNTVLWRANTKMGPLDLVPLSIPGTPAGAKSSPYKEFLKRVLSEALRIGADTYLLNGWRWGHVHDEYQVVTVYDEVPPTITPLPMDQSRITTALIDDVIHVQIEADEPGGVSRRNYDRILQRMYQVSDACDRPVTFNPEFPTEALRTFWPVSTAEQDNTFTINWKARDPGPNLGDQPNETTATMQVEVVDIRAPAIVPPPDIVEITSGQVTDLGQPLVFDFVDLNPVISHDASLPLGLGLHEVTWTATDASGNSSEAFQIVNIKNSNFDPAAIAQQGANRQDAISFEPTTLRLFGDDPDNDPLRFYIEQHPQDGFFVAPLYPYFVEDYRLEQSASDPELTAGCNGDTGPGTAPDFDLPFPSEPSYLTVNDAGTTFVLDRGRINCSSLYGDGFRRDQRIVTFDAEGGLLNSRAVGEDTFRDVIVDQFRELIYATRTSGSGSSFILVLDFDLNEVENYGLNNIRNRDTSACNPLGSDGPCEIRNARSALVDELGILYVMDKDGLIYGLVKEEGNQIRFVDYVTDDVTGGGSFVPADQLAMDSEGDLYASRNNRIYKYRGSQIGGDGRAYPGWLIGWMGRCDTDLAPGDEAVCDVTNHRSMGYSCTDEICGITDEATVTEKALCGFTFSNKGNFGCRPGQFFSPRGIDFDLRDNLYVADTANERIQRFTPEGFFAGEAESACDGSCFVLGDFGKPKDISVNSDHFYILDPATNLLHVSLLTPFTDIGPDWAELVYQSNNDFACANSADCIDQFAFSVSDGVRDPVTGLPTRSAPAAVEVEVSRNFRPPVATPGIVTVVLEDALTPILLDGAELDPLDSLSFKLAESPEHGAVTVVGDFARYRPDPDYVGEDSFSFTAFDGTSESAPEVVSVTILNLNDAPVVTPIEDRTAGVGFPLRLTSDFRDPDMGEAHLLVVNWGDGTIEPEGEIDGSGQATGPLLDETGIGLGRITAEHVYDATGLRTLEVCVTDQVDDSGETKVPTVNSLTDCVQATIDVIDALDLALGVTPSTETAVPGQMISYDFEVTNLAPAAGSGQIATGVQLEVRLSPYLDESSISIAGTGCTRDRYVVTCNFGSLGVGATDDLLITAQVPFDIGSGVMLRTRAEAILNEADQTPDNSLLQLTPVVNPGDHYVGTTDKAWLDKPDINPGDGICASEDGVCTLRAAIQQSEATPGLQVIVLGNGVYRLEESALPTISDDLVILGSGPDLTIIDGTDQGGAMQVVGDGSLRIEDLTIANTLGPALNVNAPATVRRVRFTNNYARFYFGGAILNASHLDLRDVTFDGNRSDNDGGAVWNSSSSSSTMVNVTAVGNINSAFAFVGGTHLLTNVTIIGNTGGGGWEAPAAALNVYGSNTVVTLVNTALIGNRIGPVGGAPNCVALTGSQLISGGNNLFGDLTGCNISLQPSDRVASDALLLPAADNGGGLLTMKPRPNSPVIDNGSSIECPDTDARGVARPQDGNEDGSTQCDIGAFEFRSEILFNSGFED